MTDLLEAAIQAHGGMERWRDEQAVFISRAMSCSSVAMT
jgi:hypothetical protein